MSDENYDDLPEITRSEDYVMTFADGVIVQLDGDVGRLMFYQDHVKMSDKENAGSKGAVIRFEVRMSYSNITKLGDDIKTLTEFLTKSNSFLRKNKNEELRHEVQDLRNRALTEFFDSGEVAYTSKAEHISDSFDELQARSEPEKESETK